MNLLKIYIFRKLCPHGTKKYCFLPEIKDDVFAVKLCTYSFELSGALCVLFRNMFFLSLLFSVIFFLSVSRPLHI